MNSGRVGHFASVHCRIGSLEMEAAHAVSDFLRSLPHRQFRNLAREIAVKVSSSLPHRQFRKDTIFRSIPGKCSLPHRQFRKYRMYAYEVDFSSLPHRQFRNILVSADDKRKPFTAA